MTQCITVSEMVGGGTKANDFRVAKGKFLPFLQGYTRRQRIQPDTSKARL